MPLFGLHQRTILLRLLKLALSAYYLLLCGENGAKNGVTVLKHFLPYFVLDFLREFHHADITFSISFNTPFDA
jgi:hypothetical protein